MEPQQSGDRPENTASRVGRIFALGIGLFILLLSDLAFARPVTLHVVDADVRAVLATVADLGGVGLVLDDSVQGTITIHLDEVEPEEAFALITGERGRQFDPEIVDLLPALRPLFLEVLEKE